MTSRHLTENVGAKIIGVEYQEWCPCYGRGLRGELGNYGDHDMSGQYGGRLYGPVVTCAEVFGAPGFSAAIFQIRTN